MSRDRSMNPRAAAREIKIAAAYRREANAVNDKIFSECVFKMFKTMPLNHLDQKYTPEEFAKYFLHRYAEDIPEIIRSNQEQEKQELLAREEEKERFYRENPDERPKKLSLSRAGKLTLGGNLDTKLLRASG